MGAEIAVAVNSVEAKKGSDEVCRSLEKMKKGTREAIRQQGAFSRALKATGRVASQVGRALNPLRLRNLFAGLGAFKATEFIGSVQRIERGFKSLTRTAGQSGDEILDALRKATEGTVADYDLMLTANRAMVLGVGKTREEFSKLGTLSTQLGRAMGLGPVQAFNDLSFGIGRQSRLILDNLGIIVRIEDAQEAYAKSIGKTVAELTIEEKRQSFLNAVLENADEILRRLDTRTGGVATAQERLVASTKNLATEIARRMAPGLEVLVSSLNDMLTGSERAEIAYASLRRAFALGFVEFKEGVATVGAFFQATFEKAFFEVSTRFARFLEEFSQTFLARQLGIIDDLNIAADRIRTGAVPRDLDPAIHGATGLPFDKLFQRLRDRQQFGSGGFDEQRRAIQAEFERRVIAAQGGSDIAPEGDTPGAGGGGGGAVGLGALRGRSVSRAARSATEETEKLSDAARGVGAAFGSAAGDAIRDINDLEGALSRLFQRIGEQTLQEAVISPIADQIGGVIGSLPGFGLSQKQSTPAATQDWSW